MAPHFELESFDGVTLATADVSVDPTDYPHLADARRFLLECIQV